ncbi:winged helix DNA-binding protein [Streptomyces sp. NPDC000410]|uniref:MarR family winged helix-turn-helix transcriptional regulator n=1 Tax=Streptomyces sp. NPDC000410 TaxID=3154254 RepID=UPI00331ED2AD
MEQPVFSGTAHDPSGAKFAIVAVSNMPADWAEVFRALVNADLTVDTTTAENGEALRAAVRAAAGPGEERTEPASTGGSGWAKVPGPPPRSMTPPSVLELNAYLMYAIGKTARRRLSEKLTARGLRLWHLTVLAMVSDLGPQPKGTLAARLDMNQSDLVKIVDDLLRAGQVACDRDPADRRRVVVRLTPEGRAALARLNAEISSADDDLLAPLNEAERVQLASLLRRLHGHHDTAPGVVRGQAGPAA